jgi:hypothetical protein
MAKLVLGLITIAVVAFLLLAFVLPKEAPKVIQSPDAPPSTVAWMDLAFRSEHNFFYSDNTADWKVTHIGSSINPFNTYSKHEIHVWQVNVTQYGFYGEGPYMATLNMQIFQLRDCSPSKSVAECQAQGGHRESSAFTTWESGEIKFTSKADDTFTLDIHPPTVFFKESGMYALDFQSHIHFDRGTESQDFISNDSNIFLKVA